MAARAAATMESLSSGDGGVLGREERKREMRKEREKEGFLF